MALKSQLSCGSGSDGQKGEKKGFVVCLHLQFITCLEVSAELVGTSLLLPKKKKKKKNKGSSTVEKYSISLLSSTTLVFHTFSCQQCHVSNSPRNLILCILLHISKTVLICYKFCLNVIFDYFRLLGRKDFVYGAEEI